MRLLGIILAAAIAASVVPVSAQDQPSASEMAAARRLFRSGLAHARAERWDEALADFERSYAIAQVPTTLLNLASAQVQTGELVAGAESYRRFIAEAEEGRAAEYRAQAERALAEVEARTPRVVIGADGIGDGDVLTIDGEQVSQRVMGVPFPLDPGEHAIAVARNGREVASEAVILREGEEISVALAVPPPTPAETAELGTVGADAEPEILADERGDDEGSALASPWLWAGVGAAVIAGAVVAVIVLSSGDPELYSGNLGPGMVQYE